MKRLGLLLLVALLPGTLAQDTSTVEGTVELFDEGILEASPEAALANVQGWEATLRASDDPALVAIADNLAALADALQAESVDQAAAADLFATLGEQTTAAAEANPDAEGVSQIGSLLTQVSQQLMGDITPTGGALPETGGDATGGAEAPTLEGTIAALEDDVATIPLEQASSLIAGWETTLRAAEDETLAGIADDLAALQTELQGEEMDLYEVRDIVGALGEQTLLIATNAEGETATMLERLGTLLTDLGESIEVEQ